MSKVLFPDVLHSESKDISVPFVRPSLSEKEINEVIDTLESGWLTTGPKTKLFERNFAEAVRAKYAVALNSCTAALHLAVEALGLCSRQAVLVPTMTFAATAEVILCQGATPILVDCDPLTGNMDLDDAERKIQMFHSKRLPQSISPELKIVGIIPVYVGGVLLDLEKLHDFAKKHELWIVEDAAHAFPAAWRKDEQSDWQMCGENTAAVTCYSFYANKTITTGEGGMAVTDNEVLAERIRLMSLHGLSRAAWDRHSENNNDWDYKILFPGYKYNLTDIASAIGIHQLARAEEMRRQRQSVADAYYAALSDVSEIELPPDDINRIHSWHLFPIRLNLDRLSINRDTFLAELKKQSINCSVHWRPLHLHPFYSQKFSWEASDLPVASQLWERLISLPIFPDMSAEQIAYVTETVKTICLTYSMSKKYLIAA